MENKTITDWKRIRIYLAFAFGISWITGLVIFLRGGLSDSRELVEGSGLTEAFVLMATAYMFAPAIAHALTRLITREGWQDTWLQLDVRKSWRYLLATWFGTPLLLVFGAAVYFLLFPQHFDSGLQIIRDLMADAADSGVDTSVSPAAFAAVQIFQAVLVAPVVNLIPIFGEEFGWRAYLLPKLLPLGERKAYMYSGLIWGVWHVPVILMGYNYGLDYPGAPWLGAVLFIWIAFVTGTFFGWATLKVKSVWPAIVGHAVLNGIASAVVLFTVGETSPLLGPLVVGLIGSSGFALVTAWIFWRAKDEPAGDVAVIEA
ncbi:MAG: CPBP family intramembrane metalloprotease [Anaerolineales bacterium]